MPFELQNQYLINLVDWCSDERIRCHNVQQSTKYIAGLIFVGWGFRNKDFRALLQLWSEWLDLLNKSWNPLGVFKSSHIFLHLKTCAQKSFSQRSVNTANIPPLISGHDKSSWISGNERFDLWLLFPLSLLGMQLWWWNSTGVDWTQSGHTVDRSRPGQRTAQEGRTAGAYSR